MANSVFKIENGLTVVGGDSTFGNTTTTGAFLGPVTIAGALTVTGLTTFTGGTTSSGNTVSTADFLPNSDGLSIGNTVNRWQGHFANVISYGTGGFVPSTNAIGQVLGSTTRRWVLNANTINASGLSTLTGSVTTGTANVATFNATSANVTGLTGLAGGLVVSGTTNVATFNATGLANVTSGLIVSGGIANLAGSITTGTANVAAFNATSANVTGLTGLAGLVTSGQANIATTLNVGVFGTGNGVVITNTSILVGNSTANALHNYNLISVANSSAGGIANLSPGILNIGTTTVNGTFINVGTLLATGIANVTGALSVTGAANALSTFGVRGNTVFAGNVTIGSAGLFVDASQSRIAIGSLTNPPSTTLYIQGSLHANGAANAMTTFGINGLTTAAGGLDVTGTANVSTKLNIGGGTATSNGVSISNTEITVGNTSVNSSLTRSSLSIGAPSGGQNTVLSSWNSADTDIDGLISGSPQGGLLQSPNGQHFTIGLRSNDVSDGFQVVTKQVGDITYTLNAFEVKADGKTTIANTLVVSGLTTTAAGLNVTGTANVSTNLNVTGTANVTSLTGLAGGLVVGGTTNVVTFNATGLSNASAGLNVTGTTNVSVALNIAGGITGTTNGVNLNASTLTIGNSTVNSIFLNASTLRLRADSDTYVAFGNTSRGQMNFYIGAGAGAAAEQWSINRGTGTGFLSNMAAFLNSGNSITFTANAITLNANSGSGIVSLTGLTNLNNGLVVTGTANVSTKLNAAAANITGPLVVTGGVTTLAGATISGTTNVATFNSSGTANATGLTGLAGGLVVTGGIANLAGSITTGTANVAIFNASGLSTLASGLVVTGTANVSTNLNVTGTGNVQSTFGIGGAANALSTFGVNGLLTAAGGIAAGVGTTNVATFNATGLSTLAGATISGTTNVATFNSSGTANATGLTGLAGGLVVTGTANVSVKLNAGTANVTGLTGLAGGLVVTGGIANLAGSITTGTANVAIFNATGVATLAGNTSLAAYTEKITPISVTAAGTFDLDLKVSSVFNIAYSSAGLTTANIRFINPPASGIAVSATVIIKYSGTPTGTITLQGNTAGGAQGILKYAYDSAPTLTKLANKTDILSAITYDGGTTYIVSPAFMNFTS